MHHDEWESGSSERTGGAACVVQSRCVEHGAKRWIGREIVQLCPGSTLRTGRARARVIGGTGGGEGWIFRGVGGDSRTRRVSGKAARFPGLEEKGRAWCMKARCRRWVIQDARHRLEEGGTRRL